MKQEQQMLTMAARKVNSSAQQAADPTLPGIRLCAVLEVRK